MAAPARLPDVVRFGLFEVRLSTGDLRKNGMKLKLQEQPFGVLAALLEHPGELVTREELRKRLWPADTFVEFDDGLNHAVRELREVLGDVADNPRFIETVPPAHDVRRRDRELPRQLEVRFIGATAPRRHTSVVSGRSQPIPIASMQFRGYLLWIRRAVVQRRSSGRRSLTTAK